MSDIKTTTFLEPLTKLIPLSHPGASLRVMMVLPEVFPYASVGGVSRVGAYLARELVKMGHDIRIFMPKYGFIDEEKYPLEMVVEGLKVYTDAEGDGPKELICNVKTHMSEDGVRTYFLENMEYYEQRANVYGYSDDPIRFTLLCRGVLEVLRHFEWKPQVIHSSERQTGPHSNFLKTTYAKSDLAGIASVFTIHNLFYQGMFDHRQVSELDFDDGKSRIAPIFSDQLRKQNFMKRGIIYADAVNTVSETYAREILTPEYAEGVDRLLMEVRSKLFGITNGLDYEDYDPETDPLVPKPYNFHTIDRRVINKRALQKEFGLPEGEPHFVVGMVSRLTEQKGLDILLEALPSFLSELDVQFIVVGGGEEKYVSGFRDLQKRFPKQIGSHLMLNFTLPRLVYAGAGVLTIPSRFEPAGLTQLEAMRYGCLPIVRKTGGLADSVTDLDISGETGTGFVFGEYTPWALYGALVRAYENFHHPKVWEGLVKRAMQADFSPVPPRPWGGESF